MTVKMQTMKTAIETAILLLRIDDIVSGTKKASTLTESDQTAQDRKKKEDEEKQPTDESHKD